MFIGSPISKGVFAFCEMYNRRVLFHFHQILIVLNIELFIIASHRRRYISERYVNAAVHFLICVSNLFIIENGSHGSLFLTNDVPATRRQRRQRRRRLTYF